jgi:hypothetical protein
MSTEREQRRLQYETAFTDGRHVIHAAGFPVRTKGGQLEVGGQLFPGNRALSEGQFPVEFAVDSSGRCLLARVKLEEAPPVKWAPMAGLRRMTSRALASDAITEDWVKADELRVEDGSFSISEPGFGERIEQFAHEHSAQDLDSLLALAALGVVPLTSLEANDVFQCWDLEGRRSAALRSSVPEGEYGVFGGFSSAGALTRLVVDLG